MSKSGLESDRPSLASSVCSVSNVFELGCCYHPNLGNHNILFFYAKDILMHTNLLLPKSLCSQPCDLVGCAKIRHYFCAFLAIMPSSFEAMLPIFDIEGFLLFHINYSWKIFSLSHKVLVVKHTQIQVYFIPLMTITSCRNGSSIHWDNKWQDDTMQQRRIYNNNARGWARRKS